VAKAELERIGLKVEMQAVDSQTLLSRVVRKEPVEAGGWNLTLSSAGIVDILSPVTSLFLDASCGKAAPGWPCDSRIEELRDAFSRETDPARQKQIADEIQSRAAQVGTHYPLGEWYGASAVSTKTKGWLRPPSASVFWGVERSGD
jgi:peptide/nickel transport system substrate-binding protein